MPSLGATTEIRLVGEIARAGARWRFDHAWPAQGVTAIVGPSGCGKTTLLRVVAGLEHAFVGTISFQGQAIHVPANKRRFIYVPNDGALFPHMTVGENIAFAHRISNIPRDRLQQFLEMCGVTQWLSRSVRQLSSGQKQRVALARALAAEPRLLLLDEALSNIDWYARQKLLTALRSLGMPMLYVTHAIEDIMLIADGVLRFQQGNLQPYQSVADWLSSGDDVPLTAIVRGSVRTIDDFGLAHVDCEDFVLKVPVSQPLPEKVDVRIRATDVSLSLSPLSDSSVNNVIPVVVEWLSPRRDAFRDVHLRAGEHRLFARVTDYSVHRLHLVVGKPCYAAVKSVVVN